MSGEPSAVDRLTGLLLAGRRREALELCRQGGGGSGQAYLAVGVDLLQPALHAVGELWASHRITVAEEHIASMVAAWILTTLALEQPGAGGAAGAGRGRAVLACVAGNHHSLDLQLLGEALELAGWDVTSLGPDVPVGDLVVVVARGRPELVGLSASQAGQLATLRATIAGCRLALCRGGTLFAVGGLGLAGLPDPAAAVGADRYFRDARDAVLRLGAPDPGGRDGRPAAPSPGAAALSAWAGASAAPP